VEGSACLDPLVMASDTNRKFSFLDRALNELIAGNWMSGFDADQVKRQYETVTKNENKVNVLRSFDESKDRLDTFLLQQCLQTDTNGTSSQSDHLVTFIRIILCLSHGQASVERGFSVNKDLIVENQKELSLISQRIVQDHIRSLYDGDPRKFEISKKLILSSRNAASLYREARKEESKKAASSSCANKERKRKLAEIKDKEVQKKKLMLEIDRLDQDMNILKK
jgi:hypothetical protein